MLSEIRLLWFRILNTNGLFRIPLTVYESVSNFSLHVMLFKQTVLDLL